MLECEYMYVYDAPYATILYIYIMCVCLRFSGGANWQYQTYRRTHAHTLYLSLYIYSLGSQPRVSQTGTAPHLAIPHIVVVVACLCFPNAAAIGVVPGAGVVVAEYPRL